MQFPAQPSTYFFFLNDEYNMTFTLILLLIKKSAEVPENHLYWLSPMLSYILMKSLPVINQLGCFE